MKNPKISAIAAISDNKVLGNKGKIPWQIPEDMKHFRDITLGHPIIMGRKTWDALGKPLPGRTNIVITRDKSVHPEGAQVVHSIEQAIKEAKKEKKEIFIVGGGEIYKLALPYTDKLYLTLVEGIFTGDAFFPDYSDFKKILSEEKHDSGKYKYTFLELER
jgi:dihydrofolate reductase